MLRDRFELVVWRLHPPPSSFSPPLDQRKCLGWRCFFKRSAERSLFRLSVVLSALRSLSCNLSFVPFMHWQQTTGNEWGIHCPCRRFWQTTTQPYWGGGGGGGYTACWVEQLHRYYNAPCHSFRSRACLRSLSLSLPLPLPLPLSLSLPLPLPLSLSLPLSLPLPLSLSLASPLKSARFTSSSLSVRLQSNSQMIIHLAALDSSRQPQGLRSSAKGQINTGGFFSSPPPPPPPPLPPQFFLPLHVSLLGDYAECYVYYNPHAC